MGHWKYRTGEQKGYILNYDRGQTCSEKEGKDVRKTAEG